MSTQKTTLAANARAKAGKGAARAVRRTGLVPAVIYGDNQEPVLISLSQNEMLKVVRNKAFFTSLCELSVDGKKVLTIPRDVQVDPLKDWPIHADFLRVTEKTTIRVSVPVSVKNHKDCPGLSKGGVLNIVRHEIDVLCPATNIPNEFVIDLKGLDVGTSVHISDVEMSKDVKPAIANNFTVVTIVAPSAMKSEAEEAAGAAAAAATAAAATAAPAAGAAAPAAAAAAPAKDAKAAKK